MSKLFFVASFFSFFVLFFIVFSIGYGSGYVDAGNDCVCELTQNYLSSPFQANPNNLEVYSELEFFLIDNKK